MNIENNTDSSAKIRVYCRYIITLYLAFIKNYYKNQNFLGYNESEKSNTPRE